MKISIALCTYNGAQFLQEQLESIALQTRTPDEVIICDDQSKDSTLHILRNFASKASFSVQIFLNEKNLGSTKNFEKAIMLCTGDIIFLSDQDDVWHPEKLEKIEKLFSSSPSTALIFTDAEVVDENLRPLGYSQWQAVRFSRKEQSNFKDKFLDVLIKRNIVTGSTMAFRSEFKKLLYPIPDSWVHDGWIALLIAFASDISVISEPLIKYRQHHMQQVGAGKEPITLSEKINKKIEELKTLKSSFYSFQFECIQYKLIYEHLINSQFPSIKTDKLPLLKARFSHFCVRANLPVSRRERTPLVLKELLKMNYHHYSDGIFSFVGDLLRDNTPE